MRAATLAAATALALSMAFTAAHAKSSHSVRGHVTKKGTYVAPHHKTNPDNRRSNNYSHKGNTNPHTGKQGTKE